jgi:hypothetical protein
MGSSDILSAWGRGGRVVSSPRRRRRRQLNGTSGSAFVKFSSVLTRFLGCGADPLIILQFSNTLPGRDEITPEASPFDWVGILTDWRPKTLALSGSIDSFTTQLAGYAKAGLLTVKAVLYCIIAASVGSCRSHHLNCAVADMICLAFFARQVRRECTSDRARSCTVPSL